MTFVVQMLAHTPPYVFVLLAYLIWQGALALRTRQRSVWRLLIVPVLFTATGLSLLVLRPLGGTLPIAGVARRARRVRSAGNLQPGPASWRLIARAVG